MITGTSSTSLTIGSGNQSLTTQISLGFLPGQAVTILSATKPVGGAATYWMAGLVVSYNITTGALVVNVTSFNGTGAFAAWIITVYAVNALDLTTIAEAIAYLPEMMSAPPTLIQRLVTAASSFLQTHLNRIFASASYTERRDGNGSSVLMFSNYPATAVSAVTVDGEAILPFVADPTPGYRFNETALYLKNAFFTKGIQNVTMAYTAGYTVIPFEIAQVTIELIALKYKQRERVGVTGYGMGPERISYTSTDITGDFKSLLRQYQRVVPI
jgi:hypothetical protein